MMFHSEAYPQLVNNSLSYRLSNDSCDCRRINSTYITSLVGNPFHDFLYKVFEPETKPTAKEYANI